MLIGDTNPKPDRPTNEQVLAACHEQYDAQEANKLAAQLSDAGEVASEIIRRRTECGEAINTVRKLLSHDFYALKRSMEDASLPKEKQERTLVLLNAIATVNVYLRMMVEPDTRN